MSRTAAAIALDTTPVEPIAHMLMLRVIDAPAANDTVEPAAPRVRLFDRVQLATDRLARFELQLVPVASTGDEVGR